MPIKREGRPWKSHALPFRLGSLVLLAVILALLGEIVSNAHAIDTASLSPTELYPEDFTWDDSVNALGSDAGLVVSLESAQSVDLTYDGLDTRLQTVSVSLSGQGTVEVEIDTEDSASEYEFQRMYVIPCVAGDPILGHCTVPVTSADEASALRIRLTSDVSGDFTLESVSVNEPIPWTWQPLRAGLVFLTTLLILCALFLRECSAVYDSKRLSHRLIILLPLAALMVFSVLISVWIQHDIPLLQGMTDEEAAHTRSDAYATLFETLKAGQVSVQEGPGRNILALANPYDFSERAQFGVGTSFDFALYNQEYYIYYGVAPVLTVHLPFYLLTGRVPTSRDAAMLMGLVTIAFIGWAVCGFAKRYTKGANVFALSLCCVTAVFATGTILLLSCADFYYLAELSFVCFASGALAFGLHAATRRRSATAVFQYAMSGVCYASALMSRANGTVILTVALAPLYISELVRRHARFREAAAFLLPVFLGIGLQFAYNAARFGSVLDFGATHQVTITDVNYRSVSLFDIPRALYHYLWEPLTFTDAFPYVRIDSHSASALEHFTYLMPCAGVLSFPVTWALAAMPLSAPRGLDGESVLLRRERRWMFWLPIAVSLPLMVVSYGLAGALMRYTCDFRLFYTLPALACALPLMSRTDTAERKLLAFLCVALCVFTILIGLALVFQNEHNAIQQWYPQLFYRLQRMFFPY